MANRNRQVQIGTNFWLSNEEQVYLCRILAHAKKNLPSGPPVPGDLIDEPEMIDSFRKLFDFEAENGEYEVL